MGAIETANDHAVALCAGKISILCPPIAPMEKDEALRLAAWIVAMADFDDTGEFEKVLEAVRNT